MKSDKEVIEAIRKEMDIKSIALLEKMDAMLKPYDDHQSCFADVGKRVCAIVWEWGEMLAYGEVLWVSSGGNNIFVKLFDSDGKTVCGMGHAERGKYFYDGMIDGVYGADIKVID